MINSKSLLYYWNQTYTIHVLIYHGGASVRPIATSINSSNPSENVPLNIQLTQTGDLEYI